MSEITQSNGTIKAALPAEAKPSDYRVLTFAESPRPVFNEHRDKQYVRYGDNNLYPEYLLSLYNTATRHGSIVSSKATYVAGKGWKVKGGAVDANAAAFMAKVNGRGETLEDVWRKVIRDVQIFYGAYVQVIWNNTGTAIAEHYHIDFTRVRTNKDNTQFVYRECWGSYRSGYSNQEKIYPAFNPANPRGSQILFVKAYTPGMGAYPSPDYLRGLDYINAEIEVGKHTYGNALTGFSASKSITLPIGDPTDDEKKKITNKFTDVFTGSKGRKFMLSFVQNIDKKPVIDDLGTSDLSKEDFTAVDGLIQENIFSAHKITTPALFGVSTPGALGQRSELRDGYEIFKNTYVNEAQQFIEGYVNKVARYSGVIEKLEIIPTEPIGYDIASLKDIAPKSWILEQLGIDPEKYPDAGIVGAAEQALEAETNPLLRNLSGRQWQGIKRIIREVQSGKTTDAAARMMLASGYGLDDEKISILLGTPQTGDELAMSEQMSEDDKAIMVFSEFGITGENLHILKSKAVKYHDDADAEMREHQYLAFVVDKISTLDTKIIEMIGKDKRITAETMADVLGEEVATVNRALKGLTESGVISVKGDTMHVNKVAQELPKPKIKSFRVMYSYSGPQDDRNRPFCARLMELARFYTRSEIESISARLGYSVWDRRGGFYHNPNTGKTTPYCRHTWMSHVVMETK